MTKIFFDTEFTGLVPNTTLISIGAITEYGEEFYAEVTDYDRKLITKWIFDNVIEHMFYNDDDPEFIRSSNDSTIVKGTMKYVSKAFRDWCETVYVYHIDDLEFISDVSHYDAVLLFDLFGGAINAPKYVTPAVYDINQMVADTCKITLKDAFDISRENLLEGSYEKLPDGDKHNALYDARVIKKIYENFQSNNREYIITYAHKLVMWNKEDAHLKL